MHTVLLLCNLMYYLALSQQM